MFSLSARPAAALPQPTPSTRSKTDERSCAPRTAKHADPQPRTPANGPARRPQRHSPHTPQAAGKRGATRTPRYRRTAIPPEHAHRTAQNTHCPACSTKAQSRLSPPPASARARRTPRPKTPPDAQPPHTSTQKMHSAHPNPSYTTTPGRQDPYPAPDQPKESLASPTQNKPPRGQNRACSEACPKACSESNSESETRE